jgi:DNA-binding response OmpR family regulator
MDAYVSKPFKADELLGAIDILLAARMPKGVSAPEGSGEPPDEQAAA